MAFYFVMGVFILLAISVSVIWICGCYFWEVRELKKVNDWAEKHGYEKKTHLGDF